MSLIVNTNIGSLNAQRSLASSSLELKTSMERLSSGSKINSAADDAAGFAISERMTAQIRGLNMAAKNAGDGLSMLSTIENATNDVTDMLQRLRELAVQSINDTNSIKDREYLQSEASALISEIGRVAAQTQYNGQNILDGSMSGNIQVGTESGQSVGYKINSLKADAIGSGEFVSTVQGLSFGGMHETIWSINIDGKTTNVTFGAGSGNGHGMVRDTLSAQVSGLKVTYVDGANQGFRITAANAKTLEVKISYHDGTTLNEQIVTGNGQLLSLQDSGARVATINYTGLGPHNDASDPKLTEVFDSQPGGKLSQLQVGDYVAFDNDISRYFRVEAVSVGGGGEAGIVVDGGPDLPNADLVGSKILIAESRTLNDINLVNDASGALTSISSAIEMVAGDRAQYGALQNRLEYTVSNLLNVSEFTAAARSRIADADFAAESAKLTKAQVLQQLGTAMLAQANASSQLALSLVR